MAQIPDIGQYVRGLGTLVAIERVAPPPQPPPTEDYIWEAVTAKYEVRMGGETLKASSTYWDFEGFESSVARAIEAAKAFAASKQITPTSEVEVVVIRYAERTRMLPTGSANPYDQAYLNFEAKIANSKRGMPQEEKTIVWSSRTPDEEDDKDVSTGKGKHRKAAR